MQILGDWGITQFLLHDKKISGACESSSPLSRSIISSGNADDSEKERLELRPSPTSLTNERKVARVLSRRAWRMLLSSRDRCRCIKCTDFNRVSGREITCNSRPFKYSIWFPSCRVLFYFILFYFILFSKGEREGHASIPIASSYKTYSHSE